MLTEGVGINYVAVSKYNLSVTKGTMNNAVFLQTINTNFISRAVNYPDTVFIFMTDMRSGSPMIL
jgi:hypothetical protein